MWQSIRDLNLKEQTVSLISELGEMSGNYFWSCVLEPEQNGERKSQFLKHTKHIMELVFLETHRDEWNPERLDWDHLQTMKLYDINLLLPKSEIFFQGEGKSFSS